MAAVAEALAWAYRLDAEVAREQLREHRLARLSRG